MNVHIRQESPADYPAVEQIIEAAFKTMEHSDQNEHHLVARLRNSIAFLPELSLVVSIDDRIVGHILLTKIKIKNASNSVDSLALAPVSVHPAHQRMGIGGQLIEHAHKIAKTLGFGSIVLVGHEAYYPRFGYQQADKYGIRLPFEVPPQNVMLLELQPNSLQNVHGVVEYALEFFE